MVSSMTDLSRGACAGMADATFADADIFYPEPGRGRPTTDPYEAASAICRRCAIRDLCLQDALTETVQWGYRAGMTPEQRQLLIKRTAKPSKSKLTEDDEIQRRRAYRLGWSDKRIGDLVGKSDRSIRQWRTSRNLPANYSAGGDHKPIRQQVSA